jgi:hypothetical protein
LRALVEHLLGPAFALSSLCCKRHVIAKHSLRRLERVSYGHGFEQSLAVLVEG